VVVDTTPVQSDSEVSVRPEPGLARGLWEAPSWVLFAALAGAAFAAAAWGARALSRRRTRR
jgi:hypothetical protein